MALLRGINVGANTKVDMATLRAVVESLDCGDVSTYINSGNVLFRDARSPKKLVPLLEEAIEERFGFPVAVLVRDLSSIRDLCEAIPDDWANDKRQKTDVLFLKDAVDTPDLLESVVFDPAVENVLHVHGAIVWNVARDKVRQGSSVKLIGTDLYKQMTARNVNTVRKLRDLMEAVE